MATLTEKEKENALNEVRILASIDEPNVISYKEAFIDDPSSCLCLVMEIMVTYTKKFVTIKNVRPILKKRKFGTFSFK